MDVCTHPSPAAKKPLPVVRSMDPRKRGRQTSPQFSLAETDCTSVTDSASMRTRMHGEEVIFSARVCGEWAEWSREVRARRRARWENVNSVGRFRSLREFLTPANKAPH